MAPSATVEKSASNANFGRPEVGPPKLYIPKEAQFEGYIEPQADGYRKARQAQAKNEEVAIVIDNGLAAPPTISEALANEVLL